MKDNKPNRLEKRDGKEVAASAAASASKLEPSSSMFRF